jgi:predicted DNA-binding protein
MFSHSVQLRITLPPELSNFLHAKATRLGLTASAYVKHLIINDVKDVAYPADQATTEIETAFRTAKEAEQNGDLIETTYLKDYLKNL